MSSKPIELKHISNQDAVYDPNTPGYNNSSDCDDIPLSKHRRLKWKIDLYILPLISSVYFFASMGRSDLANAKIAGLSEDLKLSSQDYSNSATMFLVGYVIAQLPGTLLLKQIGPPRQFAGAMIMWGMFTAVTVAIHNKAQLLALRLLIGAAESFIQGGVFYLSFWYQYGELATRGAIFYSMSTVAGAFNGLIAYGITKDLDSVNNWRAWRWIFLIEGIMPCAFAFAVLFLLPSSPETVRFGFTAEEKAIAVRRSRSTHNSSDVRLEHKKVPLVLTSIHFWLLVGISCCGHFCSGSLSNFLPAIINSFGYSEINTQLFTVIVYVCACIGVLFWARVADRTNARGLTLAISTCGAIAGYAMLIEVTQQQARFAATCLVAFFIYPNTVLQLSWTAMSFAGYTRR
ncbi:pantothenate transporter, putative [Paecilomyces variotii No. 5]|uniref:Pantothenate transporter, putative n=1 Tax=Byssochlamys spectabilis (strain No. 5 / NBRC 109023) TaxID=1356009 RepID=V5FY34_BYSSN|nr:pantothenate transporter, putative [Paecilomyces variotii No. 5]